MSASLPPVSVAVIIPVRNRRDLLRRTLDALDRQVHRGFDVVVVDDGSTDGSAAEAGACVVAGRSVRVVRGQGAGAVAARRLGVEATRASVLAFTDSDCTPAPTWLSAAVGHIEAGAALVHGPTRPERPPLPLERTVTDQNTGLFPTCNLAVTRAAYDEVGGFDPRAGERFGFRRSVRAAGLGFGEDTVFGWSIARRCPVVYDELMLVHHHVFEPDLRETLGRSWQMGAFPALVREVPELRRTLVRRRVLFGRRSRVPLYATVLALCTGRAHIIAAAAGWWVLHRFRFTIRRSGLALPEQARALPPQLLVDVVQAGALLSGSARARTLLL